MKRFLLLALTAGLLSPIAAKAESIPQISDLDAIDFNEPQRIDFKCPTKTTAVFIDGIKENKVTKLYPKCWVEFNNDHMNIMNRQKIYRSSIISTWSTFDYKDLDAYTIGNSKKLGWFFSYDLNGNNKIFKFTKWYTSKNNFKEINKLNLIINTWMDQ